MAAIDVLRERLEEQRNWTSVVFPSGDYVYEEGKAEGMRIALKLMEEAENAV